MLIFAIRQYQTYIQILNGINLYKIKTNMMDTIFFFKHDSVTTGRHLTKLKCFEL